MYALCVSGTMNTQGLCGSFLCAIYKFFIHSNLVVGNFAKNKLFYKKL